MKDFFIQNYMYLTKGIELFAALIGIICYKKFKDTNVKYFIYFLIYVIIIETIGGYTVYLEKYEFLNEIKEYVQTTRFRTNHWWFTIFWNIGSAMFYAFYFNRILITKRLKKIITYLISAFIISCAFHIIYCWESFFNASSIFINVFSPFVKFLIVILYFIEVLNSDKIFAFYKSMHFYVATPMFFWCLILTPLTFYNIYFNTSDWNFIILKWQIYLFANIFMYSSFVVGLLITKPNYD